MRPEFYDPQNPQIQFHTSREERLALMPKKGEDEPRKKGVFKFLTGKKVMYANFILLALMFVFFYFALPYFFANKKSESIYFKLKSDVVGTSVFIRLKVVNKGTRGAIPFTLYCNYGAQQEEYRDYLPNPGESRVYHLSMEKGAPGKIRGKVVYEEKVISLSSYIKNE